MTSKNIEIVNCLIEDDAVGLENSEKTYGDSWKKRGGVGAFMMLARKWDRIENICEQLNYDIFEGIKKDPSSTGIIDDIRDLRAYLLLVESEMEKNSIIEPKNKRLERGRVL